MMKKSSSVLSGEPASSESEPYSSELLNSNIAVSDPTTLIKSLPDESVTQRCTPIETESYTEGQRVCLRLQ